MLLLYAKYAFVFWILVDINRGDLMLMRQLSEDETLLNVTACTKRCLQSKLQKNFQDCFNGCESDNSTDLMPRSLRKVQENFLLKLVCRTDSTLSFRINWVQHSRRHNSTPNAAQPAPDSIFIIKINASEDKFINTFVYLSDENFFTIPKLAANTAHKITALAVHSDGTFSLIVMEEPFETLRRGYQPSKMGEVKLRRFLPQPENWRYIAAEIEWQPSAERNCYFDLISFSMTSQTMDEPTPVHFRDPRQLYTYILPNMTFGEQFRVGVRTVNDKNQLESLVQWLRVEAPSCLDWYNYNYTLCAPLKPHNLSVQQQHFEPDILSLNVSWSLPRYLPDNYTLYVLDLHRGSSAKKFYVAPNASFYYISNISILDTKFEVHLVAYTQGGLNSSYIFVNKAPLESWLQESSLIKLILSLFLALCCIVALCSLTLHKHKHREIRHQEPMEVKEAPTQSSEFHLPNTSNLLPSLATEDNFELDDELEVEPHAVLLQDVLGEGAFGLVRRGVYKQRQVAVKLLKDQPNAEDVQAFRCEIEMLRTVGRHPNIVGIVGYSTRCSSRMMLLTEYCGLGSLQSFLREEWKFRQERAAQDMLLTHTLPGAAKEPRRPRHLLELDTRIEDINRSMLSTLEEENEADLSRISNPIDAYKLTKLILAADNKSYGLNDIENIDANQTPPALESLKPKQKDKSEAQTTKSRIVSFENQEYFETPEATYGCARQLLTYADLLDIAQQVAVGMDFLAQNKIVHRDLAARNVLISLDRTIKIADFGLSRDVYHENVYRKSGGSGKLPIKWLALESLTHQVYTSQSDVWSFGVLLYEITTLGGMPYPSVSPKDLLQLLRRGQRMKRPDGCTDEMFALMESCWCSIPANRPTFAELKQRLDVMIMATNVLPQRLQRQLAQTQSKASPDDGHYLQPLH